MGNTTFLGNLDIKVLDSLYKQYLESPDHLDPQWRRFFEGYEFARQNFTTPDKGQPGDIEEFQKEFKVKDLINAYRERGHLFTQTNPVRTRRKYSPTLDIENFGLSSKDLDTQFKAGMEICMDGMPLLKKLQNAFSKPIARV